MLLLTGDTYSKVIHPLDKSVRTLFGDAGTATMVSAGEAPDALLGPFIYGTDGNGASRLIVPVGGFRSPRGADTQQVVADSSGNSRSHEKSCLGMDGPDVLTFSLREVPRLLNALLQKSALEESDIDYFSCFRLARQSPDAGHAGRKKLRIPESKFVIDLEDTGNTVLREHSSRCVGATEEPGIIP